MLVIVFTSRSWSRALISSRRRASRLRTMTLFKQTAGVIQSMEEQEEQAEAGARVVLPDLVAALVAATVAVLHAARVADPDGQVQVPVGHATHQVVPRGPSCR